MVTVSDFINYLQSVDAFDQVVRNVRHTELSTAKIKDDTEMLKTTFDLVNSIFPTHKVIMGMFPWERTPEGSEYWTAINVGWMLKCRALLKNTEISQNTILNYFEGKGLLQEIQAAQKRSMEEHKRKGDLPQETTLEDLYKELLVNLNMPELFLEGTFCFADEKDPEKWRKVNAEYREWVASIRE